jgi:exopolysaccharide biosynthesis protein
MKALGAQDAVALDGGGSTTIWYRGQIKNRLAKGKQRPIATALLIVPEGN